MFEEELKGLKERQLLRTVLSRDLSQGPVIVINRKRYLNFSSNDYLGLSSAPELIRAARESLGKYAFGSGSSRLLAGGSSLHRRLEESVADFKGTESALIFNSGYAANTGILPAITSEEDVILSDELNHASIIDGCRLSRARTLIYRHRDMADLESLIRKVKARRMVVVTDSVFSMDGDLAPVPAIHELCGRYGAVLYLDDAHGTGVLGGGRGVLAHFGMRPEPWILQMGTFSKALGAYGAFAAGSRDVIQWLANTARSFLFSTALPSCVIAAAAAGLRLAGRRPLLIERLWTNRKRLYEGLRDIGYDDAISETPILTIRTSSISEARRLSGYLYENRVYVPAIRPPTVRDPRLRITVTAAHTEEQIDKLVSLMKKRG